MTSKLESSFNDVTDSDVLEVKLLKKVLSAMDKEVLPSLEVITGVAEGKKFILEEDFDEGIIGRDPSADFSIEEYVISRRHAQLIKRDDGFYIEDAGSKNGTYLNNKPISEARLQDGDRISLGTIVIVFRNPKEVDFAAINKAKAVQRIIPAAPKEKTAPVSEAEIGEIPEQPLGFPATEENPAEEEELSQTASEQTGAVPEYEDDYPAPKTPAGFSSLEIGLMGLGALVFFIAIIMLVRIFTV
jgi:pSer/pThr/pTyr-binding forkhead associated (FHA) protein